MAISNSIGSNIFDICIGLAFPWVLKNGITGTYWAVTAEALLVNVLCLFASVFATVIVFVVNKW